MRKSIAISLAGWFCLILVSLAFGDALIGGFTLPHNPPFSAAVAAFCLILALPCFVVWLVGTTLYRFKVSLARSMRDAMVNAPVDPGRVPTAAWPPKIVPPAVREGGNKL